MITKYPSHTMDIYGSPTRIWKQSNFTNKLTLQMPISTVATDFVMQFPWRWRNLVVSQNANLFSVQKQFFSLKTNSWQKPL